MPKQKAKLTDDERKARKAQADIQYAKRNLHRVPLDLQNDFFDTVKHTAEKRGESVNGYIKKAILQRIESGK